jgi:LysR family transcriptional regulator, glycine cleavage system transcriptional activator
MAAAGRRLGISQAAVSLRIARLEARLRQPLFERRREGLSLTPMGRRLYEPVLTSMSGLEGALDQFEHSASHVVVVNCTPSLAADWLAPHSQDWYASHPDINLDIRADQSDLSRERMDGERIDVGVRYAPEPVRNTHELAAVQETLILVCAPDYLRKARGEDTAGLVLLTDDAPWLNATSRAELRQWRLANDLDWPDETIQERRFNLASLAYDCAAMGQGLAVGRAVLIADRVRSGRLVAARQEQAPGASYRFFAGRPALPRSPAALFAGWASARMASARVATLTALAAASGVEPPDGER